MHRSTRPPTRDSSPSYWEILVHNRTATTLQLEHTWFDNVAEHSGPIPAGMSGTLIGGSRVDGRPGDVSFWITQAKSTLLNDHDPQVLITDSGTTTAATCTNEHPEYHCTVTGPTDTGAVTLTINPR